MGRRSNDRNEERPLVTALLRGWQRRCPRCGAGPMLRGYLTVRDACPVCGESLHHQRAGDAPAWLTLLVVSLLLALALFAVLMEFSPDPGVLATLCGIGSVALSLFLLPRLKGAMVALQWARRMHGFGRRTSRG